MGIIEEFNTNCENKLWEYGNNILLDICKDKKGKDNEAKLIAKMWLIGRSYAVSLERGVKNTSAKKGDEFYTETIYKAKDKINDIISEINKKLSNKIQGK